MYAVMLNRLDMDVKGKRGVKCEEWWGSGEFEWSDYSPEIVHNKIYSSIIIFHFTFETQLNDRLKLKKAPSVHT